MKTKILMNKEWKDITREERVFCAELFFQIRQNPKPFLNLLGIGSNKTFDVGYEVCFYRDVLYDKKIANENFSDKRTFDLALFSNDEIHIIEAKAQQSFDTIQLDSFAKDREDIPKLFRRIGENPPEVYIHALISSWYTPSAETKGYFYKPTAGKLITWKDIASINDYGSSKDVFLRADDIYPHKQDESSD
jgi:hypothetical protein